MLKPKESGGEDQLNREGKIYKELYHLLHHAAEREGLKIDGQGYANVADVV
jgi:RNA:NAD 2'-phosphotransferase (TPT1/KptA family)